MSDIQQHPTVTARRRLNVLAPPATVPVEDLRRICADAGADDVGFVSISRPELDDQRQAILLAFPATKALISYVCRMNREPIRGVARSVANLEFHQTTDRVNEIGHEIVRRLEKIGVRAMNPPAGFPMEMNGFPGKVWVVSHKPVAVAAGLGQMGIHRNVIHPEFGNFILLGTILLGAAVDLESRPIDYNPCLSCKLCVAACPVGAIKSDGGFDPASCMTHNYREFMSGFTDWVETVADSPNALAYRRHVSDGETASMWQSLSFGANYKAAYCMAVCPAGSEVIGPFLDDKANFVAERVKPLQQKQETIYVVANSDAEEHVKQRFPHKKPKRVNGVRPASIAGFLDGLKIVFQAGQSKGLDAVYHFTFTGDEPRCATITIRNAKVDVQEGLTGTPDCAVTADSATWLGVLRKERNVVAGIVFRKIRVKGKISLLTAFARCFPS